MNSLSINTTTQRLVLKPKTGPDIVLTAAAAPILKFQAQGTQGPPGPPAVPGPGFMLVGAELRFSIASLPQG